MTQPRPLHPVPPRRRPRALLAVLALLALLFILFPAISRLITDWWWFQEVGYQSVFVRPILYQAVLFAVAGGLSFGVLYLNLRAAQRGLVPNPVVLNLGPGLPSFNLNATLKRLTLPATLVIGFLFGIGYASEWDVVLQALNGSSFGRADPIFARDLGYYVFTLPALSRVLGFLAALAAISFFLVLPIYWLRGDLILRGRRVQVEPSAGLHLAILMAIMFLLAAARLLFVDAANLLFSTTGPLLGASYTDLHARLPAFRLSAILAIVAAGLVLTGGIRRDLGRYALWLLGGYFAAAFLGRGVYPQVMQKLVVAPTELTREAPYLRHHIAETRRAWGLDSVEVRELTGEASLTLADIRANAPTIENVRLWDRDPLLQTFQQIQEIRTYYDFVNVDDDRYWIDGRYRQVLLSPRELNAASLPTRTFINEHLTFTHGMGLTLSPVNQVTPEGLPVLFVKDLPPTSTVSLKVTRPQVYYGERVNEFIFTGTRQREFDHPAGDENVYASYQGTGGVPVGNLFRRLVLAVRFGSSKILLSQDITNASRILYYREIRGRAQKALPFLQFDRDPYLVIREDGTLVWILDAYTGTDGYPYSARIEGGVNYLRNSVKVVLDAYQGSVVPYLTDPDDPIVRTWARIFPGLFQPFDRMPADLRAHIRYPDDLYRVQARLYTVYHMESAEDFYHREDQWQIPTIARSDQAVPFMRHIIMRLPEEQQAEFIYMVPFTPRGKDNLAAWMVARNDGPVYGKLLVYQFSRQSLVFGPQQIINRINQDTEVSRQISLWDQRGSQVIRGDLLVIPIEQSMLYVQPLYLRAEGGRIPELKRVIVAYQNQVVMEDTLDQALATLFGGTVGVRREPAVAGPVPQPSGAGEDQRTLIAEAQRHYQAALAAQREGDWARYGEEIRRLGEVLSRLGTGGRQ
jgi:uncharacterized membrane protein (UPF0182 family)